MTQRKNLERILLISLILIALSGLFKHTRIHPYAADDENIIPLITGLLGAFVVPSLFLSFRTMQYGYLLQGMMTIIGTITMAHFSISKLPPDFNLSTIIFKTLLADILVCWVNLGLAKTLFDLKLASFNQELERKVRPFRYLNMGWWWVHLAGLSAVYTLGNIFWK